MSCTAQIASSLGRTTLPFCEHDRESLNRRLALNSCNHVTISADPRLDAKATISYVMCNVGKKRGHQLTARDFEGGDWSSIRAVDGNALSLHSATKVRDWDQPCHKTNGTRALAFCANSIAALKCKLGAAMTAKS